MDSNSNAFEMSYPKIEIDSESEATSYKRDCHYNWNSENTLKLIGILEKECKELWDVKHPLYKDRAARQSKMEYIAGVFGTNADEISRKINNLRTQFKNELRRIKRKSGCEGGVAAGSRGWEYFAALTFLLRTPPDPLDTVDALNLALAEFQADEELEFGIAASANLKKAEKNKTNGSHNNTTNGIVNGTSACPTTSTVARPNNSTVARPNNSTGSPTSSTVASPTTGTFAGPTTSTSSGSRPGPVNGSDFTNILPTLISAITPIFATTSENGATPNGTSGPLIKKAKRPSRVAASAPPPLPPSAHPMMWPEEPLPRIRPGLNADECQIFGDFVASELRTLRSDESRKKLRRLIQKVILQVGEEEDVNIISG